MKKKILALILACATVLSLTVCGGNTAANPETNSASTETENKTPDIPLVNKDAWKDGKVTINGYELTIGKTKFGPANKGAKFSDKRTLRDGNLVYLEEIREDANLEVEAYDIYEHSIYKKEDTLSTQVIKFKNPYDKTIDRKDCVLENVTSYYPNDDIFNNILAGKSEFAFDDIVLPNDITYGASEQNILDAYGDPSYIKNEVKVIGSCYAKVYAYETDTIKLILWVKNDKVIGFKYFIIDAKDNNNTYWSDYAKENPLQ